MLYTMQCISTHSYKWKWKLAGRFWILKITWYEVKYTFWTFKITRSVIQNISNQTSLAKNLNDNQFVELKKELFFLIIKEKRCLSLWHYDLFWFSKDTKFANNWEFEQYFNQIRYFARRLQSCSRLILIAFSRVDSFSLIDYC